MLCIDSVKYMLKTFAKKRRIDLVYRHFQQYYSYIVAVSFIGGGTGEHHRPASH